MTLRTQSFAVQAASMFALLAIAALWPCVCGLAFARQRPATQTPAPSPTVAAPAQATPARTGRSYDSSAPVKKPASAAPQAQSPVTFTDITSQSGVTFRHDASSTSQKYLLETMGGGCAMFDYDNDGRMDLYFTNGAKLEGAMPKGSMPDKSEPRFWNRLYHQKSDGTFEDATVRAGVRGAGYSMGVAAGDFDGDGWVDLYVTAYGGNTLYRNKGTGAFEDVARRTGTNASGWSTSAGWLDYDRDGRLDLFVARYMDWDFERGAIFCGDPRFRAFCHPDNFKGAANILFHQKPDGTFEDVSERAGIADPAGKGLGVAFADFDDDGLTDIFVANDSVRQSLYHNKGTGAFEDVALLAGVGYDENGKTFAGMGVDVADYDNDGLPDILITALSNETYPLFRNAGDLSFVYTTGTSGLGQITLLYSGWGTHFIDADNDGLRDIFAAQGHVLDTVEKTTSFLAYRQEPLLARNTGRNFVNVSASAGFNVPLAARGAAFGDLDNDGDTDIVLAQTGGPPVILRNNGTKNHWLGLALVGVKKNRQGLGARVQITDAAGGRQIFDVTCAGSYLSSNDGRVLAGLGTKTGVRSVEVRWPDGQIQTVNNPAVDKYLTINEK
ncbi:MAG: FG-GAP-like repeat-containing protein [Acidobacteria bacterium]|nr:FG-GAP-like repeat-containing protein [Acidobacteriota bacterium]